ncbi:MAG: hypothetical protein QY326_08220 [Bdellovibrionota bacterium]|nr:MAG: hypothetical protein QY326_08220 [Bdellovibrionota bacterium]
MRVPKLVWGALGFLIIAAIMWFSRFGGSVGEIASIGNVCRKETHAPHPEAPLLQETMRLVGEYRVGTAFRPGPHLRLFGQVLYLRRTAESEPEFVVHFDADLSAPIESQPDKSILLAEGHFALDQDWVPVFHLKNYRTVPSLSDPRSGALSACQNLLRVEEGRVRDFCDAQQMHCPLTFSQLHAAIPIDHPDQPESSDLWRIVYLVGEKMVLGDSHELYYVCDYSTARQTISSAEVCLETFFIGE